MLPARPPLSPLPHIGPALLSGSLSEAAHAGRGHHYLWVESYSEEHARPFFFNQETKVSSWERPPDLGAPRPAAVAALARTCVALGGGPL